jgi:hypothetical protein
MPTEDAREKSERAANNLRGCRDLHRSWTTPGGDEAPPGMNLDFLADVLDLAEEGTPEPLEQGAINPLAAALAPDWTATPDVHRETTEYRHNDGRHFVVTDSIADLGAVVPPMVEALRTDTSPPGCLLTFAFARNGGGGALSATVGPASDVLAAGA